MPTNVTTSRASARRLAPAASRAEIREAKQLLKGAGHEPGRVDGQPSAAFSRALRTFQKAWKLPVTGTLNERTQAKLRLTGQRQEHRGERFVTTGMKGAPIRTIEARLKKLGYDVGKVDGIFSKSTFEAVKAFKADTAKIKNEDGSLGAPGQKVLMRAAKAASIEPQPGKNRDANVRAVTFNWPSRYKKGGEAADEALFDRLSAKADVMGFPEFKWGHKKITDRESKWAIHNPNPPKDGDNERAGQVLAWRKDTFKLVETGTSLLNRPTRIQQKAAGPTIHRSKSVIWAKLRHRETGEVWTVAVVHLVPSKHLGGAAEKLWRTQRDNLAKWMKQQGPRTLVMGDFNAKWSDGIAKPLHKVAKAQTAPSHGKRAIDWVLRSKDLEAVHNGKALDNGGQSDHRPVQGVVRG